MDELLNILRQYWGYDGFRPLQAEAMQAVLSGQDSLVVLPTGGGKSLCFQAPALALPGLAVVVSPLISLMKDQVDGLRDCGVPAACVNKTLSIDEKRSVAEEIRSGRLKLLYLSPEKLMTQRTLEFLKSVPLSFMAVDEAHCISDWGHDFRPEYRMLQRLRECFPGVALHGYTATATPRVQEDIVRQMRLVDPAVLVGSFDRPNLVYRVQRRGDLLGQIREVIERHPGESGIIYCIRRADVDDVCGALAALGLSALPYHAGLSDDVRRENQDAFINDRAQLIVATVAFGMGIDKPDVRYVIHAGAPKSLEHYQQESGRAGRDGLEADCCLLFSGGDFQTWRKLQGELPGEAHQHAMTVLAGMEQYCTGVTCRHRAIVEYFGQALESVPCQACDVCQGELDLVAEPLVLAQKIISCVARLEQGFGAEYTSLVLAGSQEQRIMDRGHNRLSTWGLLKEHDKRHVRDWIEQLVGQGCLQKEGEYQVLTIPDLGRRVLRGEETPRLLKPAIRKQRSAPAPASWEGVDRGLFEALRDWRRQKAAQRGLPPFLLFSDETLRDLARRRPTTPQRLLDIHGVGERKSAEYGGEVLAEIDRYCRDANLDRDVRPAPGVPSRRAAATLGSSRTAAKQHAIELFKQGKSIDDVQQTVDRARSTVLEYLCEHIEQEGICDASFWLDEALCQRVQQAALKVGGDRLKPIFEALEGAVPYDEIRLALACLRQSGQA